MDKYPKGDAMKNSWRAGVALLALALAACQSQKGPAQASLSSAQAAFDSVGADAQKYAPEQAKPIQDALAAATDAAAKGDYKAVLAQTESLTTQISALSAAVNAKKTELAAAWPALSAGVPKLVGALKSRVDILSASRRLPAGLTAETVNAAKTGLESATQLWTEATTAAEANDLAGAATKGAEVKAKVVEAMKSLNMKLPTGI